MKRPSKELSEQLVSALVDAIQDLGAKVERHEELGGGLSLQIAGAPVVVETRQALRSSEAEGIVALARLLPHPLLVAAERVPQRVREACMAAGIGYYDARGRIRLVLPGVFIDAEVPSAVSRPAPEGPPLGAEAARDVALVLLEEPRLVRGVREIARAVARAPSTVSLALERLRREGLLDEARTPKARELFVELASQWRSDPVPLARAPDPADEDLMSALGVVPGDLALSGWALAGESAAVAWGADVDDGGLPQFYVPGRSQLERAVATLGAARLGVRPGCTASTPPARHACRSRVARPNVAWPVVSHVVTALDLAGLPDGSDRLARFEPAGYVRVW